MMLISIIVPVYNVEKFLKRCVDSIIDQTYIDWELLLIDDGSKDQSGSICDEYASKYEKINVYHLENGGVSKARNYGIEHAHGDWITFIDSDDFVNEDYLLNLSNQGELKVDTFYSSGIQFVTPTGKRKDMFRYPQRFFPIRSTKDMYDLDILANGCPVAKLFNKDILLSHEVKFNEELSLNEDHIFVIDYLHFISNIQLSSSVSYNYWFDNTVPSLTKISHNIDESLQASIAINKSIISLLGKFSCNIETIIQPQSIHIFGAQQILRAAVRAVSYKNAHDSMRKIANVTNLLKVDTGNLFGIEKFLFLTLKTRKLAISIFLVRLHIYMYGLKRFFIRIIKKTFLKK